MKTRIIILILISFSFVACNLKDKVEVLAPEKREETQTTEVVSTQNFFERFQTSFRCDGKSVVLKRVHYNSYIQEDDSRLENNRYFWLSIYFLPNNKMKVFYDYQSKVGKDPKGWLDGYYRVSKDERLGFYIKVKNEEFLVFEGIIPSGDRKDLKSFRLIVNNSYWSEQFKISTEQQNDNRAKINDEYLIIPKSYDKIINGLTCE